MQPYKWDALDYAKSSSAQQQWARELIGKLQLKGDETLLDIGCGDGKVTAEIAACLPMGSVLGVDSSAEMIALAQSQYPADCLSQSAVSERRCAQLAIPRRVHRRLFERHAALGSRSRARFAAEYSQA